MIPPPAELEAEQSLCSLTVSRSVLRGLHGFALTTQSHQPKMSKGGAWPHPYVALKPTAPGFKYATDRDLIAPEVPVTFFSEIEKAFGAILVGPSKWAFLPDLN